MSAGPKGKTSCCTIDPNIKHKMKFDKKVINAHMLILTFKLLAGEVATSLDNEFQ